MYIIHWDRICENVPNCGFNIISYYALAAFLYAYIILSLLRFFLVFMNCYLLYSRFGKYGTPTPFRPLLRAVRKIRTLHARYAKTE